MLIGNAVFAATQFLMLVALTSATSPETVGRYALALALTAPAYFAASLKLRHVAISDTAGEFSTRQYVGTRVGAILLVWLVIAAVTPWAPLGGLLLSVSSLKALDMTSDILYSLPHRAGHLVGISASMSTRGILSVAAFVGGLTVFGTVEAAVWGAVVVHASAVVFDYCYARRHGDPRPILSWSSNKKLVLMTAPLGLAMATSSFGAMLPRYALEATQGARAVGIYSAVAYLLVLGGLVVNSLAQAAAPQLAKQLAVRDLDTFRSHVRRLTLFGALLGVAGVALAAAAGRPILRLVFGPEYASGAQALVILMVGAAISYSAVFAGTALNALRRFEVPLPVTALSAVVAAALLVPASSWWGIEGAAAVTAVTALLELVLYHRAVRREYERLAVLESTNAS